MTRVYTGASMSLDGYIAGPQDSGFEHLFAWYNNGSTVVPTANEHIGLSMNDASTAHYRQILDATGALIVGRHLFDMTNAWGGQHPMGVPVVVLTHRPPDEPPDGTGEFHFVSDGIERAVATAAELAGDKVVGVNGGTIAIQCLNAGLLDEIWIDLVPVLMGEGTPFFSGLVGAPLRLEDPVVRESHSVTHLRYRITNQES